MSIMVDQLQVIDVVNTHLILKVTKLIDRVEDRAFMLGSSYSITLDSLAPVSCRIDADFSEDVQLMKILSFSPFSFSLMSPLRSSFSTD